MTTIKDFLKMDISIDVVDDMSDDLWIAFDGPITLTEEGERKFHSVLNLLVEFNNNYDTAIVLLNHRKDCERLERKCIELFESLAGYCSADDWDRWFTFEG